MRKVDMYWYADKEETCIRHKEENNMICSLYEFTYRLNDFNNWTDLYNKAIEDFDAEYDDMIAEGLETICLQIWKEKDKICDSATQE